MNIGFARYSFSISNNNIILNSRWHSKKLDHLQRASHHFQDYVFVNLSCHSQVTVAWCSCLLYWIVGLPMAKVARRACLLPMTWNTVWRTNSHWRSRGVLSTTTRKDCILNWKERNLIKLNNKKQAENMSHNEREQSFEFPSLLCFFLSFFFFKKKPKDESRLRRRNDFISEKIGTNVLFKDRVYHYCQNLSFSLSMLKKICLSFSCLFVCYSMFFYVFFNYFLFLILIEHLRESGWKNISKQSEEQVQFWFLYIDY